MVRLVLFWFIGYASFIFSQDYVSKFSIFLPETVVEDQGIRNEINESITNSAAINPFLISDIINFANDYYGKKLTKPGENGIKKLSKLKSYHLAKESFWADSILQIIRTADLHYIIKFRLRYTFNKIYFENVKLPDSIDLKDPINSDYYFVYVSLSGIENSEYDMRADYHSLVNREISRITSEMDKEAECFSTLSDNEQNNFIDKIISYHYLFTDKRFNAKFNFSIQDLVNIAYKQSYKYRSHLALTFAHATKNLYQWNASSIFSYAFRTQNGSIKSFDFPVYTDLTMDYSIGFSYQQSLKEYVGVFNYLKIGFQFVHINTRTMLHNQPTLFPWVYKYEGAAYFEKVPKGNPVGSGKGYMLNGYAAVPLFYFSKDLNIEAGIMINFNQITASYSMEAEDVKVDQTRTIIGIENINKNFRWYNTEVSFLFTAIYKVFSFVEISAQGIFYEKMAGAMIGTSLGFDL